MKWSSPEDQLDFGMIPLIRHFGFENVADYIQNFKHDEAFLLRPNATSTWLVPVASCAVYILLVFALPPLLKKTNAFQLSLLLPIWNLFLTILSVFMSAGILPSLLNYPYVHGPYKTFCDPDQMRFDGPVGFWLWVFLLSKYLEFLDTLWLILRKKNVIFLHWYHHATVIFLFTALFYYRAVTGAHSAAVNSAIHVIMYWYFYRVESGAKLWWGFILTALQIMQMIAGLVANAFFAYYRLQGNKCSSDWGVLTFSLSYSIIGSYFVLFVLFFRKRWLMKREVRKEKTQ